MSGIRGGCEEPEAGRNRLRPSARGPFRLALAAVLLLGPPSRARAGELTGQVTTAGGHPVREAVIFVDQIRTGPSAGRRLMDQRNRTFIPHVMAVQLGTRVEFPNHDTVFHNVFSYREGKRFDLGLYPVGTMRVVNFDQPGLVCVPRDALLIRFQPSHQPRHDGETHDRNQGEHGQHQWCSTRHRSGRRWTSFWTSARPRKWPSPPRLPSPAREVIKEYRPVTIPSSPLKVVFAPSHRAKGAG